MVSPEQVDIEEHDQDEMKYIESYNRSRIEKGDEPLEKSSKLTEVALNEAQRLAELSLLEFPDKQLLDWYYGTSFKISGKIENTYGQCLLFKEKLFFNSLK